MGCTVTASDGTATGNTDSVSVTIGNTPPVLADVTLSPDPAYEADTLSCDPGMVSDADGAVLFDYAYAWQVNGVDVVETSYALDGDAFDRDDEVVCFITPNDGVDDGDAVESNAVVISNTPPDITDVEITPSTPTFTDTLMCSYSGYADDDGDADSSTYSWTVDGTELATTSTLSSGFVTGDTVVCTVTPYDGDDAGTAISASVTIENTAPEVTEITLSPDPVYTDDVLAAVATTNDVDGDAVSLSYDWYVDGTLVASGSSGTLDGLSAFNKDEEVYVVATPNDGMDDGDPLSSDSIVVSNSPPGAPELSIDIVEGGGCESDWTETSDGTRCLQAFAVTATWNEALTACEDEGGTLARIADSSDDSLAADLVAAISSYPEFWVGYNDIDSEGTFVWSDGGAVTYTNWRSTEPNDSGGEDCTQVETGGLWNDMPCDYSSTSYVCQKDAGAQNLQCFIDYESVDADEDAVTYTFEWTVDGLAYSDATTTDEVGDTVPGEDIHEEEEWTCTVTPHDGDDMGTAGEVSTVIEDECDTDGDGWDSEDCGGWDCDDDDADIYPFAGDAYGDGVDSDCDTLDCNAGFSGSTYFTACYDGLSWSDAESACQGVGYDGLASILDSTENTDITNLLHSGSSASLEDIYWIGINNFYSSWGWSSGLSVSYTNWNSGEPSGDGNCGHIYSDLWSVVGMWNDHPCSNQQSYVCEMR